MLTCPYCGHSWSTHDLSMTPEDYKQAKLNRERLDLEKRHPDMREPTDATKLLFRSDSAKKRRRSITPKKQQASSAQPKLQPVSYDPLTKRFTFQ